MMEVQPQFCSAGFVPSPLKAEYCQACGKSSALLITLTIEAPSASQRPPDLGIHNAALDKPPQEVDLAAGQSQLGRL